jgi:hypothetical protein
MGPILQIRKTWKSENFFLEEVCDEEGNFTYYLDNIYFVSHPNQKRTKNITDFKNHLQKIIDELKEISEEEIINNLESQER